ncbi:PrsW family glutamic-type intramembrane protease [Myxococcus sp. K15C18031901]|uniref:PrsW family intramembrane metalloprotease n=1 Tax=Myxococcus dinghuensis TaxID=2906761 RepID=UPI0020A7CEA1|nr:PrsW family intramembrane metalloprotease [Myxococcus dinghuensis]MCP3105051.1 PrsW family glutamic-type intramembrane protease [Myxococcus dinghuensis]
MLDLLLAGSAIVPSLLLFWYIRSRDQRPEPAGVLLGTFLLGAAICIPVVPVAMALEKLGQTWVMGTWSSALSQSFLGAAIPEELFKFLVLYRYAWRKPAFDEPVDGVVYGATASLGFATLENVLYVSDGGLGVAFMRAITAVPGHAFMGVVMGAFVGRARRRPAGQRFSLLAAGLGWAILLHGAYDLFLMTHTGYAVLSLVVLGILVWWGRRLYLELQADQREHMRLSAHLAHVRRVAGLPPGAPDDIPLPHHPGAPLPAEFVAEPGRSPWNWMKLAIASTGLTIVALMTVAGFHQLLYMPERDGLHVASWVVTLALFHIPTVPFLRLFRSGLRLEPVPRFTGPG